MPAVEAPGRSRPITRNHADDRLMQQCAVTSDDGFLLAAGIQRSGGSPRSVSPKNPGGATPITVKGWPSTMKVEPTTAVSPP